jgi:hypothetical protein
LRIDKNVLSSGVERKIEGRRAFAASRSNAGLGVFITAKAKGKN